jgi:sugar lactone lactonase YvrE
MGKGITIRKHEYFNEVICILITALVALLALPASARAVTPMFFENFSRDKMLAGSLDHVSLAPDGTLSLAPAYDALFETGEDYIFSMARDSQGNIYVGTGGSGKVFQIDPQGNGILWFQAKEPNVFALAVDASDVLYAGSSPDGRIYKITGEYEYEEFCNPQARYIWAMVFDDNGNLYVGAGGEGVIRRVDKDGKLESSGTAFYASGDTHVRSLIMRDGNLLAGTAPGGKIVEITPDGKGFTLADTPLEEINALASGPDGTIYAAASASSATAPRGISGVAAAGVSAGDGASMKSLIYAINRNGDTEIVFDSGNQAVYDIVVRTDRTLLMATGPKGRLLELDTSGNVVFLTDSPEENVTRLVIDDDDVYTATSNQGKTYRLRSSPAASGTYVSDVLDAGTVASWGRIFWRYSGGAAVEISTRAGNTGTPDKSWSDWSDTFKSSGDEITGPKARYLQWRAVFKAGNAAAVAHDAAGKLNQVRISYLAQNLRPRITEITVLAPGVELQPQPSMSGGMGIAGAPPGGRPLLAPRERGRDLIPLDPKLVLTRGAQSFTWKAVDENSDALEYFVYFKGEDESDWKLLAEKAADTFYTLNTAALPDGVYRLKVAVSDEPSNPPETALSGEKISEPFVVAGAAPEVEITGSEIEDKKAVVRFRASVRTGSIASAEYSVDGGEWHLVFPVDGIADSAVEEYRIVTPELSPGEHLIGVRAGDRNGTTGTTGVLLRFP